MPWVIGSAIIGSSVLGAGASLLGANKQADAANQANAGIDARYQQTRADLAPWMRAGQVSLGQLQKLSGLIPGTQETPGTSAGFPPGTNPMGAFLSGQRPSPGTPGTPGTPDSFDPNATLVKPFGLQDFNESPAYQFNLQEGEKAINKGAAARGNYYAPQTLQDLGKFSQGLASNEFNNAYSQYNTNMNNIWNRLYGMSASGQNAAAQLGGFGANAASQVGNNLTSAGAAQAGGYMGAANTLANAGGSAYNAYLTNQILSQNQRPNFGKIPGGLPGGADY